MSTESDRIKLVLYSERDRDRGEGLINLQKKLLKNDCHLFCNIILCN